MTVSHHIPAVPVYTPPPDLLSSPEPIMTVDDSLSPPPPRSASQPSILDLFESARAASRPLFIAAPMVRYSKLPYRLLLRNLGLDVVYTPMMLAREFKNSPHARIADFSTTASDAAVTLAQFGANSPADLVAATRIILPYVAGVGLNCGCPIKDQISSGIGAALMRKIDLVEDMVRALRAEFEDSLVIDVKIRIHPDISETLDFARRVAAAGANIVTVHGRRTKDRSGAVPVNLEAIKRVRDALPKHVYVVANGDCFSLADARRIASETGVDGVMAARGLLENPALFLEPFSGKQTPWKALELYCAYAELYGLKGKFQHLQLAIVDMTVGLLTKQERQQLRMARNWEQLMEYIDSKFVLKRRGQPGFAELEYEGFRKS